jgi:hypothetical protein
MANVLKGRTNDWEVCDIFKHVSTFLGALTLSLLMSYIYISLKVRNFTVVYIYIYIYVYVYGPTFGNAESRLFLFAAQCFNIESMQKVFLCHSCV